MCVLRVALSLMLLFVVQPSAQQTAQPTTQRDSLALGLLQKSIAAMGGIVPADSVATGSVVIVAGSDSDKGTVRILTRGTNQTPEEAQLSQGSRVSTYSRGAAREATNGTSAILSLETTLVSQSACFPLPFLLGALSNPDGAVQFVGTENANGQSLNHVRLWNTFASNSKLQYLAEFTVVDVWLDPTSGLPLRISVALREGGGSSPLVPLDVYFSEYRNIAGVLYPFLIQKSLNGTPWMTITISSVSFNTGLTDASFSVQ